MVRYVCPRNGEIVNCWECGAEVPHKVERWEDVRRSPRCERHEVYLVRVQ